MYVLLYLKQKIFRLNNNVVFYIMFVPKITTMLLTLSVHKNLYTPYSNTPELIK